VCVAEWKNGQMDVMYVRYLNCTNRYRFLATTDLECKGISCELCNDILGFQYLLLQTTVWVYTILFTNINLSTNPPSTKADFFPQLCSYRTLPTQRNLILPYKYLRRPNKSLHMLVLQFQIQRDEASLRHVYPLFYHVVPEEML
jgi:hypothetical protein